MNYNEHLAGYIKISHNRHKRLTYSVFLTLVGISSATAGCPPVELTSTTPATSITDDYVGNIYYRRQCWN